MADIVLNRSAAEPDERRQILKNLIWAAGLVPRGLGKRHRQASTLISCDAKADTQPLEGRPCGRSRRGTNHQSRLKTTKELMELGRTIGSMACRSATTSVRRAKEADIEDMLKLAGLERLRTHRPSMTAAPGTPFDRKVTVWVYLQDKAHPPRGRQDPRSFDRTDTRSLPSQPCGGLSDSSARPAVSAGNGSVAPRGLRASVHAPEC